MSAVGQDPSEQHPAESPPPARRRGDRPDTQATVTRLGDPCARPHRRRSDPVPRVSRPAGTPAGDRQLLRAAALGDEKAWELIVDVYAPTVWSACLQCGLHPDEAAAVSSVVWMSLLDAMPHLDAPLATWLVGAAIHEGQQARRRAAETAGWGGDRRRKPRPAPGLG